MQKDKCSSSSSPTNLYMYQLFTHCFPTIICVMLTTIVIFFYFIFAVFQFFLFFFCACASYTIIRVLQPCIVVLHMVILFCIVYTVHVVVALYEFTCVVFGG